MFLKRLLAIFAIALLIGLAMSWTTQGTLLTARMPEFAVATAMVLLGLQKLQDIESFSTMFLNYDLLAQRYVPYSYVYPYAETAAGLLMLAGTLIWVAAPLALFVGTVGAVSAPVASVATTARRQSAAPICAAGALVADSVGVYRARFESALTDSGLRWRSANTRLRWSAAALTERNADADGLREYDAEVEVYEVGSVSNFAR